MLNLSKVKYLVWISAMLFLSIGFNAHGREKCNLDQRFEEWNKNGSQSVIDRCGICPPSEMRQLKEDGYSFKDIKKMCSSDESDTQEDNSDAKPQYTPRQYAPAPAQYCCDMFGNRRCLINTSPEGSQCVCFGQGSGVACR